MREVQRSKRRCSAASFEPTSSSGDGLVKRVCDDETSRKRRWPDFRTCDGSEQLREQRAGDRVRGMCAAKLLGAPRRSTVELRKAGSFGARWLTAAHRGAIA